MYYIILGHTKHEKAITSHLRITHNNLRHYNTLLYFRVRIYPLCKLKTCPCIIQNKRGSKANTYWNYISCMLYRSTDVTRLEVKLVVRLISVSRKIISLLKSSTIIITLPYQFYAPFLHILLLLVFPVFTFMTITLKTTCIHVIGNTE